ncbi:hypothetical protein HYDPIDRAFT_25058 [Hydnomerulius pinastri MD-312]|nr:hypothetical protein HYDPIDRAFT_25058 [Hydnomerulius pinastri MD-312]
MPSASDEKDQRYIVLGGSAALMYRDGQELYTRASHVKRMQNSGWLLVLPFQSSVSALPSVFA